MLTKWESTDESIAVITESNDQTATVKAVGPGRAFIRAYSEDGKCYGTCGIYVELEEVKNLKAIGITNEKMKSGKNTSIHLGKFRYESTNKKIATVSKKGVIKGIKKGSCYVYVYTQNGLYKRIKVRVK